MKTLYMEVTKDEYELPVVVAESLSELSRMTGLSLSGLSHRFHDKLKPGRRSKYVRVEIDEDEGEKEERHARTNERTACEIHF